ncbi:MAG: DUF3549 family protein [Pseudomonadota bacterium]
MNTTTTLSDFFDKSHTRYRVFDMGRGIRKIDPEHFRRFESGRQPYPFPLQQQAWLGILGWNEQDKAEQFIWFLKFPLDETAHLIQATRDDFMGQLLANLGHNIQASQEGGDLQDGLKESPYGFKPKESAMAAFHAHATASLGQPPSRFYDHAKNYFDGEPGYEQWAFVGIQGIADVAARLEQDDNLQRVVKALPQLPAPALSALCGFLENENLPTELTEALLARLRQELTAEQPDINSAATLLRAFACCPATGLRDTAIRSALESPLGENVNILAAIAARNWEALQEAELARLFVEKLAHNNLGQEAFIQLMADLLYIPGMRPSLLTQLRNPERSEALSKAVGAMFKTQL